VENTIAFYWATHMYRSYPIRVETGAKEARTTRVV
jgi:hypothetical protein